MVPECARSANYDTTAFAQKMDKAIFPNQLHFKVAFTGCHNDCADEAEVSSPLY